MALAILISFTSCSSDEYSQLDGSSPKTDKQSITFVLKGITSEITNIATRSTSVTNPDLQVQHVEYWVYKNAEQISASDECLAHQVIIGEDIDKSIKIELTSGDYKIFFYATDQKDITVENTPMNINAVDYQYQMFSKTLDISVSENTTPIQEIVLEREVGQIQLVINDLDKLPENVKSIRPFIDVAYLYSGTTFLGKPSGLDIVDSNHYTMYTDLEYPIKTTPFPILKRDDFKTINIDNPLSFYSLTSTSRTSMGNLVPGSLYIMGCTDDQEQTFDPMFSWMEQNPKIVFIRKVGTYNVKKNQITRYTGNIGSIVQGSSGIILDETWDKTVVDISNQ